MASVKKKVEKEKTMDLVDLRNKVVIKLEGAIEIEKIVSWDNTNGQRGVMKNSYLSISVQGKKGKIDLIVGKTKNNIWLGKKLEESEIKDSKPEVLET